VSVIGDALCGNCALPDAHVWIDINGSWTQVMPTSLSSSLITFNLPQPLNIGDDFIVWVSVPGGETSKTVVIQ